MALTQREETDIREAIADLAEDAKRCVRGSDHYRATVILRATHLPNGDVLVSEDNREKVLGAIQKGWPSDAASGAAPNETADIHRRCQACAKRLEAFGVERVTASVSADLLLEAASLIRGYDQSLLVCQVLHRRENPDANYAVDPHAEVPGTPSTRDAESASSSYVNGRLPHEEKD